MPDDKHCYRHTVKLNLGQNYFENVEYNYQ